MTAMASMEPASVFARWLAVLSEMVSRPSGLVGLVLVAFHVVLAIVSPVIAPYDFRELSAEIILNAPSSEHWFGTDNLGRDVFTRTMLGGRQALLVTTVSTVLAITWGGLLGVLLGLVGGRLDELLMRLVDAFLCLPWILVLLLIVVMVGFGAGVLILTLGFFYGIPVIRMARAATHDVVTLDFVTAARARGESRSTIVWRELVPNVLDVLMVEGAMRWSWMLLAFSSLSFLGFGVTPPTPDWGLMISDARTFMSFAPWTALAPVIALSSLIHRDKPERRCPCQVLGNRPGPKSAGLDRSMREPLVRVDNLGIGFTSQAGLVLPILRNIDLVVGKGETVGLVGESGCGKSTLVLAMLGYLKTGLRVLEGESRFRGRNVLEMDERTLQSIRGGELALIPQNAGQSLTPTSRIGRQIDESVTLHTGLAKEERLGARSSNCCGRCASRSPRSCWRATPTSSRAVSNSALRSPWRWRASRMFCCSTSRRPASTSPRRPISSSCCGTSRPKPGPRWSM